VAQEHPVKVLTVVTVLLMAVAVVVEQRVRVLLTILRLAFTQTVAQARRLRFQVQAYFEAVVEQAHQVVQVALVAAATPEPQAPLTQAVAVVECQAILAQLVPRAVRAW
jgi:hypothetical protein